MIQARPFCTQQRTTTRVPFSPLVIVHTQKMLLARKAMTYIQGCSWTAAKFQALDPKNSLFLILLLSILN